MSSVFNRLVHYLCGISHKEDTYDVYSLYCLLHRAAVLCVLAEVIVLEMKACNVVWSGNTQVGLMPFCLSIEIAHFQNC